MGDTAAQETLGSGGIYIYLSTLGQCCRPFRLLVRTNSTKVSVYHLELGGVGTLSSFA